MGHHFVPQKYLSAFQDPTEPGMIWTYPRNGQPRLAGIKNVAQSSGFYDPDVETDLNRYVETPANPILDMLRRGEPVSAEQRYQVALYVGTMIKRVPRSRVRGGTIIPQAIDATAARMKTQMVERAARGGGDPAHLEKALRRVDEWRQRVLVAPPAEVLEVIRLPWATRQIVDTIFGMQWRVLTAEPPEMFITSDNPAFFDEGTGIGRPDSELCFPLSPTHCLHCSYARIPGTGLAFMPFHRETVREMNRRIVSAATSIVMAHRKESWPTKLLRKSPDLHRMCWN